MSLQLRVPLAALVLLVAFAGLEHVVHERLLMADFIALERDEARQDAERVVEAVSREIQHLSTLCQDWAAWDDTYEFVLGRRPSYVQTNLAPSTYTDARLVALLFVRRDGNLHWGRTWDYRRQRPIALPELSGDGLRRLLPRLWCEKPGSEVSGVISTSRGPVLAVSRPILRSDSSGPPVGLVIMARLLDDALVRSLVEQTRVQFSILSPEQVRGESGKDGMLTDVGDVGFQEESPGGRLYVSVPYPDLYGKPSLILRAEVPRNISQFGRRATRLQTISSACIALFAALLMVAMVGRMVIAPLAELERSVVRVRQDPQLAGRAPEHGARELASLGREFNRLVEQLAQARQELIEQSERLREANEALQQDIAQRQAIEARLREHEQQLEELASELSLVEERERRRLATLLHDEIGQPLAIARIKLADARGQDADLTAVIDEALVLIGHALEQSRSLTSELSPPILYELGLEPALEWLVETTEQRHGIRGSYTSDGKHKPVSNEVQVMVFQAVREMLVNTAKHAAAKTVTVSTTCDGDQLVVEVFDDGRGFDPAALRSSPDAQPGFGLFSIRERLRHLGGTLEVRSRPGEGTHVVLRAPLQTQIQSQTQGGESA